MKSVNKLNKQIARTTDLFYSIDLSIEISEIYKNDFFDKEERSVRLWMKEAFGKTKYKNDYLFKLGLIILYGHFEEFRERTAVSFLKNEFPEYFIESRNSTAKWLESFGKIFGKELLEPHEASLLLEIEVLRHKLLHTDGKVDKRLMELVARFDVSHFAIIKNRKLSLGSELFFSGNKAFPILNMILVKLLKSFKEKDIS